MKYRFPLVAMICIASVLLANSAMAEKLGLVGKWHWNPKLSSAIADGPPPKDVLLNIASATDKLVQWTVTQTDDKGQPYTVSFNGPPNALPKLLQGGQAGTTVVFSVTEGAMKVTFRSPGGDSDTQDCSMSTDAKRLTCRGTIVYKDGKSVNYLDVYDRV
jgi:hypothetical protein